MAHISRRNEPMDDINEHHLSKWESLSAAHIVTRTPQKEAPSRPKATAR